MKRLGASLAGLTAAFIIAGLLSACAAMAAQAQQSIRAADVLLPAPASVQTLNGVYRPVARLTVALTGAESAELNGLGDAAADILRQAWGRPVDIRRAGSGRADLTLALRPDASAPPESYSLQVGSEGMSISAPTAAGLFYGLQTLRQLAPTGAPLDGVAAVRIEDQPRFAYRGLHLDVARHMMPVEDIKRHLDLMARYKFNVFHWHLTDDQGWRLEIKRYPKLTEVGAWRRESPLERNVVPYVGDRTPYGGFYTQEQVREIVDYARARHIEVIPEIDLPGHTVAVLAAYPELACTPGPFEVYTTWGVADDILCPSEESFAFITGVMDEVMTLFPSHYIHVGGDEAPTVRWEHSPLAQEIIRREGLKDEHALQGWFLRRVERYLNEHGRSIIGWDEILDGNPDPSTTVMSWRGMSGGIEAARLGHNVIMSPTDYAYLDYCQGDATREPLCNSGGDLPLERVYRFDPVPDVLTPEQATRVIGGQANLWTEYLKTTADMNYMYWPRALAISEAVWSSPQARDWTGFLHRLPAQFAVLDDLGVPYRTPGVEGLNRERLTLTPQTTVILDRPFPGAVIRYTLDGTDPDLTSPVYTAPLTVPVSAEDVTVVSALAYTAGGRASPVARVTYRRTQLRPAMTQTPAALRPGLTRRYFQGNISRVAQLDSLTSLRQDIAESAAIPDSAREVSFGLTFDGYLRIPRDGVYDFDLHSDDGSDLRIGDAVIVDRDGWRSAGVSSGAVALSAGLHPVCIRYFQGGGGKQLRLTVSIDGAAPIDVPVSWWSHEATQ